jgi:hypothetical protein
MGSPKAQHEFVVELITSYPWLVRAVAGIAGTVFPEHDRLELGPTAHRLPEGRTVHGDAAVRMVRGGRPAHFAQVEVQKEYGWDKLVTLRAYHASEVRRSGCGGQVFVLSPRPEVSEKFAENEKRAAEELAFRASYLSSADLTPLAGEDRRLPERALAAAAADFGKGLPGGALALVSELRQESEFLADLLFTAIMEECPDDREVEQAMTPEVLARLEGIPSFRAWQEKARATGHDQGIQEGRQEGRQEGIQQGRRQGKADGMLQGKAQTLIQFFTTRGDAVPAHAVTDILTCPDTGTLDGWVERAFGGETAQQIFGPRTE